MKTVHNTRAHWKISVRRFAACILVVCHILTVNAVPVQAAIPAEKKEQTQSPQVSTNQEKLQNEIRQKLLPLADMGFPQSTANAPLPIIVQEPEKKDFEAGEVVSMIVTNPDRDVLGTKVINVDGKEVPVEIYTIERGNETEVLLSPKNQFVPGKFTLEVRDAQGTTAKQDFTWGVLALNTDKSRYKPGEEAAISIGVLDHLGEMVCNAVVTLKIRDASAKTVAELSTENKKIEVNSVCSLKEFTLESDYETQYVFSEAGDYSLELHAETSNGSYTITDTITVTEDIPFDIKRTSATRLYPPLTYPMTIEVTANQDFEGTITETVPDSFIITPADEAGTYDGTETIYFNGRDPETALEQNVLGASTASLRMPFDGAFAVSQGFGGLLTDISLREFYSHYGLAGHDGVDFALPTGTPLYAVDDGTVLVAGDGDYGITVILEHSWGRSYYGHLRNVATQTGIAVKKGSLIGYSGNTGESTGPHLHFGLKPLNPDTQNGYAGKIDPLPYLQGASNIQTLAEQFQLDNAAAVLSASDSAMPQNASQSATPEPPALEPTLEQTQPASTSASVPFTVLSKDMEEDIADSESTVTEKVKIVKWNVSLKKGEKTTLSYAWKAPSVSPQFYLLGTLKVFNLAQEQVYEDGRKWQLAADAQGADWYDYSWSHRKQISILDAQVPGTLTDFPVLVSLSSDTGLNSRAQADGDDILFTDSTGRTKLSHEIESYSSGTLVAWVKVPTLNGSSDTDIYMYYGNATTSSQQDAANVWDSNFRNVYHMKGTSGSAVIPDSATNVGGTENGTKESGTGAGQPANTASGKIGEGQDFNEPTTDYISITDRLGEPANVTISGWFKLDNQDSFSSDFVSIGDYISIKIDANPGGSIYNENCYHYSGGSRCTNDVGASYEGTGWHYISYAIDDTGNAQRVYVDGVLASSSTYTESILYTGLGDNDTQIGRHGYQFAEPRYFDGQMDEIRVSNTARSANWAITEYNNQVTPSNFYTVGSEETKAYAPANSELMRHGKFFDGRNAEQPFVF